ncbi:MAG: tetratricopeptide repeat protein [Candidatus Cyclobacteriaceae bacterium M3_2C_046]
MTPFRALFSVYLFLIIENGSFAAEISRDTIPESLKNRIEVNIRIAEYFLDSKLDVAILYADSAEQSAQTIDFTEGILWSREIKAKALQKRANYEQALKYYDQVIDLATQLQDYDKMAQGYIAIGEIYLGLKKYEPAIETLERGLKLEENIISPEVLTSLYTNCWTACWKLNQFKKALVFQEKALEIYKQNQDNQRIARKLNSIGLTFRRLNQLDQALKYYMKTLKLDQDHGRQEEIARTMHHIGEIYLLQQKPAEAIDYFSQALKLKKAIGKKEAYVDSYLLLGKALMQRELYETAGDTLQTALHLAVQVQDIPHIVETHQALAWLYRLNGQTEASLTYYDQYMAWKDSLFNMEIAQKIADISANYEFNQKEREIALLANEKKLLTAEANIQQLKSRSKSYLIILLMVLIAFSSMMAFIMHRRHENKKKDNQTITKQYQEISKQKEQVEKQRDIIARNIRELEEAQQIINIQNSKLRQVNEVLEEKVSLRTREVRRAFQKLSFHIDNTPLAIMEWNNQMKLIKWSQQAEKIFGISAREVLDCSLEELPFLHPEEKPRAHQQLKTLMEGKKPRNFYKLRGLNKKGDLLILEWSNSILFNEEGDMESILSIAQDVSDREKAYFDLQELNNELDNFIYRASHDLQGPLARMQGLIQLAHMETSDQISLQYFEMLANVNAELGSILSRLRMVYNFYQQDITLEDLSLGDTVSDIIRKYKLSKPVKHITFKNQMNGDIILRTDRKLFEILIENMIENALHYENGNKPVISFEACQQDQAVSLLVRDNGSGIPDKLKQKVFDIFFRGSENTAEGRMHLYMAKKAVTRMGGHIKLIKLRNQTTFELFLPYLNQT